MAVSLFSLIESAIFVGLSALARLAITIFLLMGILLTSRVVDSFLASSVAAAELFASGFAESFFSSVVALLAASAFAEPFVWPSVAAAEA